MNLNMTLAEQEDINQLISLLSNYAEAHSLTLPELFGRIEMVKQSIWYNAFGSEDNFEEDDEQDTEP